MRGQLSGPALFAGTEDFELKKFAVTLIDKTGSFEYTRQVLIGLERDLLAEIEKLGGNPMLVVIVKKLAALYA